MRHGLNRMSVFSIGLAVCTTLSASSLAEDGSRAAASDVPPNIHLVSSGGYWSRGEREGFFRIIVTADGIEHISHRLFLQWMAIDPVTQSYSVVDTRDVKETNEGHGYLLDVKVEYGAPGSVDLSVFARRDRPPQEIHFTISAKGDGSYYVMSR
jgi:hypothetical protein